MAEIMKVTARWDGFSGAPGYSNFFFVDQADTSYPSNADAAAIANRVSFFLEAIKGLFPPTVKITPQSDVPVITAETGKMSGVVSAGGFGATTGTAAAGAYSAASGAVVTWRTGGIRNGRRVRGRTFLVPTANTAYEADGTLNASALTTLTTAATALFTGTTGRDLVVYARPTVTKNPDGTKTTGTDGNWYPVSSATVPDRVAVLRSRRA